MTEGTMPPEDRERLRAVLQQLGEELERARTADEATREKLEALADEVRALLDEGPQVSPEAHRTFGSRLTEELAQLEGSHPDLAYTVAQVIETLSGLGI
jgi:hypothetical protein